AALRRADALSGLPGGVPGGLPSGPAGPGAVDGPAEARGFRPGGGNLLAGPGPDPGAVTPLFHLRCDAGVCTAGVVFRPAPGGGRRPDTGGRAELRRL